ncbi:MAG: deoxyribose-phosphate aldolase [Polyangiales bacterium]
MQTRIAEAIEHTLLTPDATLSAIDALCDEAMRHRFAGVCIPSAHVARAASRMARSNVRVVTVVGYPLGCVVTEAKVAETRAAIALGAHELDVVMHLGALKDGDDAAVLADLTAVVVAAEGRPVKVILETGLLSDAEKVRGAELSVAAGAAYVKTCTGFPGRGTATVEDVRLLSETVAGRARVKASGGIRTREDALRLLAAGATRLGTSSGPRLVAGEPSPSSIPPSY